MDFYPIKDVGICPILFSEITKNKPREGATAVLSNNKFIIEEAGVR